MTTEEEIPTEEIQETPPTEETVPELNLEQFQEELQKTQQKLEAEILNRDVEIFIRDTEENLKRDGIRFEREKLNKVLAHTNLTRENYQTVIKDLIDGVSYKFQIETPPNSQVRTDIVPEDRQDQQKDFNHFLSQLWRKF